MAKIVRVYGRELLDSRGNPTVEAEVELASGVRASAIAPSGASTGIHEALELRDGDEKRYLGKGVLKAVRNVKETLSKAIQGKDPQDLNAIDQALLDADGTQNKSHLGANAILAVSLASAKAAALESGVSFAEWIQKRCQAMGYATQASLPVPLMNVINGGAHADNGLDVQEFMIVPHGFKTFAEALRAGTEVFHHLKKILHKQGHTTAVGDEGGFAPKLSSNKEALVLITEAIKKANYKIGTQVSVALDVAASEFYREGVYDFKDPTVGKLKIEGLISYYKSLSKEFPLVSIEDGCAEEDWEGWKALTLALGSNLQLIGDDLFVTQVKRLAEGIEKGWANAILIKLNQVGTLSETLETMKLSSKKGYRSVVSHRSGETEDTSVAHLAVGTGAGQIKTGSLSRSERIAKYNEILRLEERLSYPFAQSQY